jgi:hypothetical protein
MDLTEGSETSAKLNLTPGKYPKENIQNTWEVLKCGAGEGWRRSVGTVRVKERNMLLEI